MNIVLELEEESARTGDRAAHSACSERAGMTRLWTRSRTLPWLFLPFVLVIAACSSPAPTPTPTVTPQPTPTATPDLARFTDFTLPRAGGGVVTFSDYQGEKPLVVVFYRGYFCSICRIQMRELQEVYPQFQSLGAEVIAISTDNQSDAEELVASLELDYPVLYDTGGAVSRAWRVFNLLGDGIAAPATFVFNGAGDLIAQRIGTDAGDRPTAAETLEVIRQSLEGGVA